MGRALRYSDRLVHLDSFETESMAGAWGHYRDAAESRSDSWHLDR